MTTGEAILGAIGVVAAIVVAAEVKRASDRRRQGRCAVCGEPADDGECDACNDLRSQK